MRRLALLLLVVLLVACGGDSGSDADDGGGASGDSATTSAGGSGGDTGEISGNGAAAAAAAGESQVGADAAAMGDPAATTGVRAVLEASFDDTTRSPFIAEELPNGAVAELADGTYRLTPPDGETQTMLPKSIPALNDGVMQVTASLDGDGAAGVVIRTRKDPQGTFNGYVCWISQPAGAGCASTVKDAYTVLFTAADGSIELVDANVLRVAMVGSQLQFEVNGVVVGSIEDTTSVTGNWGLYAESFGGGVTAVFDDVAIYRAPKTFLSQ